MVTWFIFFIIVWVIVPHWRGIVAGILGLIFLGWVLGILEPISEFISANFGLILFIFIIVGACVGICVWIIKMGIPIPKRFSRQRNNRSLHRINRYSTKTISTQLSSTDNTSTTHEPIHNQNISQQRTRAMDTKAQKVAKYQKIALEAMRSGDRDTANCWFFLAEEEKKHF